MANKDNLKPVRTKEEARERGKKGGIKSGEVRRERKTLKDELLLLLATGNTQNKVSLALIEKALSGDTKAFEVIRDTIGEKAVEKVENTNIELSYEDYIKKVEDADEY
jgi:vacuolar-type H+-ATPase subunit B/Vma2